MASVQVEFKAIFDEHFASLLRSGVSKAAAAAQALMHAQEIVRQRNVAPVHTADVKNAVVSTVASPIAPVHTPTPPRKLSGI